MADSSAVDAAVVAKASGDATLMALATDGVFFDVADNGATDFILVSQVDHEDENAFEGCALEEFLYLIKGVFRSEGDSDGSKAKAAAARIHELYQDQPLTITGYAHSLTRRAERVRYTEVDGLDARWHHRGGRYRVAVSPS